MAKKFQGNWAIIQEKIATKTFQKQPNLVTLLPDVVGVSRLMQCADEAVANAEPLEVDVHHLIRVVLPVLQVGVGQGEDVGPAVGFPKSVKLTIAKILENKSSLCGADLKNYLA